MVDYEQASMAIEEAQDKRRQQELDQIAAIER